MLVANSPFSAGSAHNFSRSTCSTSSTITSGHPIAHRSINASQPGLLPVANRPAATGQLLNRLPSRRVLAPALMASQNGAYNGSNISQKENNGVSTTATGAEQLDFAIVGGGPSGLLMAKALLSIMPGAKVQVSVPSYMNTATRYSSAGCAAPQ